MAASAVGAYSLFGPEGRKNRKKAKKWIMKAKETISEKAEDLEEVGTPLYEDSKEVLKKIYHKWTK